MMDRRTLMIGAGAGLISPWASAQAAERRFAPAPSDWRSFELTLDVQVADVQGTTRLWLPLPDLDTDYQRTLDSAWSGNARSARIVADPRRDTRMFYAEFDAAQPVITVTTRLQTRNRVVDWSKKTGHVHEDAQVLRRALAPTEMIPTDGVVRQTALAAIRGVPDDDIARTRAIYDWVVDNAFREPKVRGCGTGDVRTMLETGNLGGKCADLNAVFVGLCRSVGIPARDVYGLRLVPSAFGYRELGANPASLKAAQHCRAEVFLKQHGWVAMDPADVLKVMRQETPDWIKDPAHPLAAPVVKGLFGSWEGNWVGYNRAHDLHLPGQRGDASLPFLMYPQGENASGRFDELAPDAFKYSISAKELPA
jgi:transglutaminase-like putative cysteine protease